MHKPLLITGLHGLKSNSKYDFSRSIAEGTHIQISFCKYKKDNSGQQMPNKSWTAIISDENLFKILKENGYLVLEK